MRSHFQKYIEKQKMTPARLEPASSASASRYLFYGLRGHSNLTREYCVNLSFWVKFPQDRSGTDPDLLRCATIESHCSLAVEHPLPARDSWFDPCRRLSLLLPVPIAPDSSRIFIRRLSGNLEQRFVGLVVMTPALHAGGRLIPPRSICSCFLFPNGKAPRRI